MAQKMTLFIKNMNYCKFKYVSKCVIFCAIKHPSTGHKKNERFPIKTFKFFLRHRPLFCPKVLNFNYFGFFSISSDDGARR